MKRWIWIGVPVIALGALVFWRVNGERAKAAELEQQSQSRRGASPSVEVAIVGSRPLEERIEAIGTLESPSTARLSPKVSGRIERVLVREGDFVKAGQVLVEMDGDELEAAVLQQQAAVSAAKARLAEAELTSGSTDVGVTSVIRQQQAALASAQADYNQASKTVDAQVAAQEAEVENVRARVSAAQSGVKNAQAELVAAEANLKNANSKLERAKALFEKGYIAAREVEDAQTVVDTAQAGVGVREGELEAANSAVVSARAQLTAADKQLAIVRQRGTADIAAAKARLDQVKASLAAAQANTSQSSAYRANLTALRANVAAAEAQLRQARTRKMDANLVSPVDGRVTERNADPGTVAGANQPVVTIQSLQWLFVKVNLPVDQAGKVRQGQSIRMQLDAFPDDSFGGTITEINPSADERTRQFTVRARIDNRDERLRPGMFARVSLITSLTEPRVVVPKEAVKTGDEASTVLVVDDEGKATTRKITTGASDDSGFEVRSGLEPGDRVVILSYNAVRDDQTVKVTAETSVDGKRTVVEPEKKGGGGS